MTEALRLRPAATRTGVSGIFSAGLIARTLTVLVFVASALGLLSVPVDIYDDSLLLLGARLVAGGKTPYIDFYTHHGPLGYTILAFLGRLFGNPGLALRMGEILLLTGLAILWHALFRSLLPESPLREYPVPLLVAAVSAVALQPAFFGFAFATGALVLFLFARNTAGEPPATLLNVAAAVTLAVAVLIRPVFAAYSADALLLLEAVGRPRLRGLRNPLAALAIFFGTAAGSVLLLWPFLYPKISPALAFNAAIITPARLMGVGGARYRGLMRAIATGSALVTTTIAWTISVSRRSVRCLAAGGLASGSLLPLLLTVSERSGRDAGFLSLTLFVLAGSIVFFARHELQGSALLRASATFGLRSAVVWRADKYQFDRVSPSANARSPFDDFFDRLYPITAAKFGDYDVRVRALGGPASLGRSPGIGP